MAFAVVMFNHSQTDDEMGSWIPLAAKIKDVVAYLARARMEAAATDGCLPGKAVAAVSATDRCSVAKQNECAACLAQVPRNLRIANGSDVARPSILQALETEKPTSEAVGENASEVVVPLSGRDAAGENDFIAEPPVEASSA